MKFRFDGTLSDWLMLIAIAGIYIWSVWFKYRTTQKPLSIKEKAVLSHALDFYTAGLLKASLDPDVEKEDVADSLIIVDRILDKLA